MAHSTVQLLARRFLHLENKMYNDIEKLKELDKIRGENFFAFAKIADFLNNIPKLLTSEIIEEITGGVSENHEKIVSTFLATALCDSEDESELLEKEYLKKSVKQLCPSNYTENPFFKNVKIPRVKEENWELGYQSYDPYECFVYDDIELLPNLREIPKIGYFTEEFSFPTVFEDGIEWMAIKPNEIETMKPHLAKMSGDVCVFGLGIGYFAYMASRKSEVNSVTVVERDSSVIKLFEKHILPQFENKEKIKIVKADAFEYAKNTMPKEKFNHAFVDLWHDASDGVELYIKMKRLEAKNSGTEFSYWIEKTLLSSIRWQIFSGIKQRIESGKFDEPYEKILMYISDDYLKNFVKFL